MTPDVLHPGAAPRPLRLLSVDDNAALRASLRALLALEDDIELVGEAADGPSGAALAAALQPDVVLLDIAMPGGDGIEAARRIKRDAPGTRIVFFVAEAVWRSAALGAGADAFLLKETPISTVLDTIRAVAQRPARPHAPAAGPTGRVPSAIDAPSFADVSPSAAEGPAASADAGSIIGPLAQHLRQAAEVLRAAATRIAEGLTRPALLQEPAAEAARRLARDAHDAVIPALLAVLREFSAVEGAAAPPGASRPGAVAPPAARAVARQPAANAVPSSARGIGPLDAAGPAAAPAAPLPALVLPLRAPGVTGVTGVTGVATAAESAAGAPLDAAPLRLPTALRRPSEQPPPDEVTLTVHPFAALDAVPLFLDALRTTPGIGEVRARRFVGGRLHLTLLCRQPATLAERLRGLPGYRLTVREEADHALEVVVGSRASREVGPG